MLRKGAIRIVERSQNQFLSPIFLVEKKDSGYRPVINLKKLNQNILYIHFKMEDLSLLKELLQKGDFLCKLDLKDAYFSVALHKISRKYLRFPWQGNLYEFLCVCFGLGPAPRIFTKLMKIPMTSVRRLNVRLIIYLDDILVMRSSLEQIMMSRDTLIFVLQNLGFVINFQKSVLNPSHQIRFLGVEIDSLSMIVSLPIQKKDQFISQCQDLLNQSDVSLRQMTQLISRLSSEAIAVLPAPLQYRSLQRQQILELAEKKSFSAQVVLSKEGREEIQWWIENLMLSKGRAVISHPPQLIITSDASLQGRGAACQGQATGGPCTAEEQKHHINILELKAAKLAILTFIRMHPEVKSIHLRMDNIVGLSYIVKMGETHNKVLSDIRKEIWDFLLLKEITITVEYLPGVLNQEADFQSRSLKDSSEWKLKSQIFEALCSLRGANFETRVSHQLPCYISRKLDPFSKGRDAFQRSWKYQKGYVFPPFSLIGGVLRKVQMEQAQFLLVTPTWQSQSWYPHLIQMSVHKPILIPQVEDLLMGPKMEKHPLIEKGKLRLLAWTILGKSYLQKEFQRMLQSLSQVPKGKVQSLITNRPGESGIAGAVGNKLIPLVAL